MVCVYGASDGAAADGARTVCKYARPSAYRQELGLSAYKPEVGQTICSPLEEPKRRPPEEAQKTPQKRCTCRLFRKSFRWMPREGGKHALCITQFVDLSAWLSVYLSYYPSAYLVVPSW